MTRKIDRAFDATEDLATLTQFRQTQRALDEQMRDLYSLANRFGLYDAADHIRPR
jgi:hypothetical protein